MVERSHIPEASKCNNLSNSEKVYCLYFLLVYVSMYLCVSSVGVCVWLYICVQRPEVDVLCPPQPSLLIQRLYRSWLEPTTSATLTDQQAPGIHLSFDVPTSLICYFGVAGSCYLTQLPCVSQGTKLRSSCLHSTLPSEPSPQPPTVISYFDVIVTQNYLIETVYGRKDLFGSQFQRVSDHLGRIGVTQD